MSYRSFARAIYQYGLVLGFVMLSQRRNAQEASSTKNPTTAVGISPDAHFLSNQLAQAHLERSSVAVDLHPSAPPAPLLYIGIQALLSPDCADISAQRLLWPASLRGFCFSLSDSVSCPPSANP